ncbi:hypothetical protein [Roseateles sp. P5_E7]
MAGGVGAAVGRFPPLAAKFSGAAQALTAASGLGVVGALLLHAGRPHAGPGLLLQPSPERLL